LISETLDATGSAGCRLRLFYGDAPSARRECLMFQNLRTSNEFAANDAGSWIAHLRPVT